jgi:hypothetical protein
MRENGAKFYVLLRTQGVWESLRGRCASKATTAKYGNQLPRCVANVAMSETHSVVRELSPLLAKTSRYLGFLFARPVL